MTIAPTTHVASVPPAGRAASEPPELRGLRRDGVRLMVVRSYGIDHAVFRFLGDFLRPGDLVVVNTSATLAAAVDAERAGSPIRVHFATELDDGSWTIELRTADGAFPLFDGAAGESIALIGGACLEIRSVYTGIEGRSRLLRARADIDRSLEGYLATFGRPISYRYVPESWPLTMYQTVFARHPGSAEMPSAGRPFSPELVTELITGGIGVAPIVLHTGVSSFERGERPAPERLSVPSATARVVNETRRAGGKVIAVGTTVTRALESSVDRFGRVRATTGWTDLVLEPPAATKIVDGILTGWHPPEASHRSLLEAVAGTEMVNEAYSTAIAAGYLWHEFGDSCLLLP